MRHIKKIFALVLSLFLLCTLAPVSALADPVSEVASGNLADTVFWRVTDDGVLTIGGTGDLPGYWYSQVRDAPYYPYCDQISSLVIEEGITAIRACAFYQFHCLTGSLVIPDSVKYIDHRAFYECDGFTGTLTLGSGLQTIGDYAFYCCRGFTGGLTIPDSMVSIGSLAFYECENLDGVFSLGTENSHLQTIGNSAFCNCRKLTGGISIPSGVTKIENHVFGGCWGLTGPLDLGGASGNLQSIGDYAFTWCTGLGGTLVLPDSLTSIGDGAFSNCAQLTGSLNIPAAVTTIGRDAFSACSGFTGSLTLGGENSQLQTIGISAFYKCSGFTGDLVIPDGVTDIGQNTFYSCSGFNGTLTLGNHLQNIGEKAFCACSGLQGDLIIPNTVTSIKKDAFSVCGGFNGRLVLSNSLTEIGDSAFSNCKNLSGDLVIPDSVTQIGNSAFVWCTGFNETLTLGTENSNLQTIGERAFCYCSGFTGGVTIPDSVTQIGQSAFENCRNFNGPLVLGGENSALQSIGDGAFQSCGFTGDLVIPDKVTYIGDSAFIHCSGFNGTLTIGNAVETIGKNAFYNCSGLTGTLVLPESVTSVGDCAFHGCAKDTDVLTFFGDDSPFIELEQIAYTAPTITDPGSATYKVWCTCAAHTGEQGLFVREATKIIPYIFIDAITANPTEVSLWPGETVQIGTIVTPDNAMDPNVTFTSDHTDVVTVDENGVLTAVAPGTATVTIVPADTSDSATATVRVTVKQPVTSITATADRYVLDMEDAPYTQITVTVLPEEADNKDVIYTSSDPTVLDVEADGLVIALHQGAATVTVTAADGKGAQTTIDFTVTNDLYALRIGPTVEEEETGDATVETNTVRRFTVRYASSDPEILEVDPDTGAFTAKKKGTVTVTAELDFEDGGHKTLSQDVLVRDPHEGEFRCSRCDWYDKVKDTPGIRGVIYWMIHTITHFVELINWMT